MPDVPINPEYASEVHEIARIVQSHTLISKSQLEEWMEHSCREIQSIAFRCLVERESRCPPIDEQVRQEFICSFLQTSIAENVENDFRISRFDALLYCRSILEKNINSKRTLLLHSIAKMLADICARSDEIGRQEVVDVVLEHVLIDEDLKKIFAFWQTTPELRVSYNQGVELAKRWQEMKD